MKRDRVLILGAAGRDFHNFNMVYRDDPKSEVVAFTAAQIPGIDRRTYPAALAGDLYPEGIAIRAEHELETICAEQNVSTVVFAYSDVPYHHVMTLASRSLGAGADFVLFGPERTMLRAQRPVIAVSAVRTGCGKSQTARWIASRLRQANVRVAAIRHPMPYGWLERQAVQRFATREDLAQANCTIEEREEYEPYVANGHVVFAGVDYARIVNAAESETDVILWDGGNNDFPFVRPDLHFVLVDALRAGHEQSHHPGAAVLNMADMILVAKSDAVSPDERAAIITRLRSTHPNVPIVCVASPVTLESTGQLSGARVVVVEDGPTTTHGGMPWGAGYVAASRAGAVIVDPRPYAHGTLANVYERHAHLGPVLPAMGYSTKQISDLSATIDRVGADFVVSGTPIDLAGLLQVRTPIVRARYEFAEIDTPGVGAAVDEFVRRLGLPSAPRS